MAPAMTATAITPVVTMSHGARPRRRDQVPDSIVANYLSYCFETLIVAQPSQAETICRCYCRDCPRARRSTRQRLPGTVRRALATQYQCSGEPAHVAWFTRRQESVARRFTAQPGRLKVLRREPISPSWTLEALSLGCPAMAGFRRASGEGKVPAWPIECDSLTRAELGHPPTSPRSTLTNATAPAYCRCLCPLLFLGHGLGLLLNVLVDQHGLGLSANHARIDDDLGDRRLSRNAIHRVE